MKKIISLAIAIIIAFSFLAFPFVVSADYETGMTNQEYYAAQSYLIAKYKDGKISYSEFQQQSQAVTDEFVSKNTVGGVLQSGALNASNTFNAVSQKIGDTVQKYGDSARDYLSSIVSNFFDDYTVLNDKPTTDLNGSGALFEWYDPDGCLAKRVYCEYIIRDSSGSFKCYGDIHEIIYYPNGTIQNEYKYPYGSTGGYVGWTSMPEYQKFYGDVRYEDGTQAPTDDTFETITDYDFTQATEKELEDLIKDLLNEFELQMPDLSSIEGLLNAIYARLGTLDSDNDNSLLSDINSSIQSLNSSISEASSSIETAINDLKETVSSLLSNEDDNTDNDTVKHEIAGTLYNVIPLEKNWLRKFSDTVFDNKANLKVEYEGKVYYLEDDGTLKLGDKYYKVDMNYSSTLDEILDTLLDIRDSVSLLTEEEKKMSFDDFFDLKLTDLKSDFDENFAFKDNIKDFLSNIFYEFEKAVPKYESGDE